MKTFYQLIIAPEQIGQRPVILGTFTNENNANKVRNSLRNSSEIREDSLRVNPIAIFESEEEYFEIERRRLIANAMEKLTKKEKEVLGLDIEKLLDANKNT